MSHLAGLALASLPCDYRSACVAVGARPRAAPKADRRALHQPGLLVLRRGRRLFRRARQARRRRRALAACGLLGLSRLAGHARRPGATPSGSATMRRSIGSRASTRRRSIMNGSDGYRRQQPRRRSTRRSQNLRSAGSGDDEARRRHAWRSRSAARPLPHRLAGDDPARAPHVRGGGGDRARRERRLDDRLLQCRARHAPDRHVGRQTP